MIARDFIQLDFKTSRFIEISRFDKIVADVHPMWCESEPEVDTVGIDVEIIRVRIKNASFGYDLTI